MKNMNPKMVRLLHEGFSISTLENLTEGQLNLLYEKIKKEPKEQVAVTAMKYDLKNVDQKNKFLDDTKNVTDKNKVNFDPTTDTATVAETELQEKSKSKKQQQFFGIVRGMQKGDIPKKGEAGKKAKEMDPKDVKDFASTKHKGLPKKVESKEDKENIKKLEEGILKLIEDYLPPHTTKGDLLKTIKTIKR